MSQSSSAREAFETVLQPLTSVPLSGNYRLVSVCGNKAGFAKA